MGWLTLLLRLQMPTWFWRLTQTVSSSVNTFTSTASNRERFNSLARQSSLLASGQASCWMIFQARMMALLAAFVISSVSQRRASFLAWEDLHDNHSTPSSWPLFNLNSHSHLRAKMEMTLLPPPPPPPQILMEPTALLLLHRVIYWITFQNKCICNSPFLLYSTPVAATPNSVVSVQSIGDLRLGDRVIVTSSQGSKAGVLRYLGTAEFAVGQWAGVELDDPSGKNDGAVAGTRYFECQQHYGLFAPIHKVSRSPANHMRRTSGAMNASMSSSLSQPRAGGSSRTGTRRDSESASVTSVATSRASTAISRVRSTINNPRLGVNSLTSTYSPTHQAKTQVFS